MNTSSMIVSAVPPAGTTGLGEATGSRPSRVILRPLAMAGVLTAGGVIALAGPLGALVLIGLIGYAVLAALLATHLRTARFGRANGVTLLRGVGTSVILGIATQVAFGAVRPGAAIALLSIGTACLALDGVDGKVARARGEVSVSGARFDMETDAAMLLGLSVAVAALGVTGWWVLLIGGMRYLYVGAAWLVPALRIPVRTRFSGKVIAVAQGIALLAGLLVAVLGVGPVWLPGLLAGAALTALGYSFGRDVVWQVRTARAVSLSVRRAPQAVRATRRYSARFGAPTTTTRMPSAARAGSAGQPSESRGSRR